MIDFFSCQRPWAFYGLLFLIPAIALTIIRYVRLTKVIYLESSSVLARIRRCLVSRMVWWGLAWVMLILAFSGISWGMESRAVHQVGSSVSFVFDISYSMTAEDVYQNKSQTISRLEASTAYASALLERLDGVEVSAVIAKGEGYIAIPMTTDKNALYPLFASLSPKLMTATGSSIGSGITAAASSFPALSLSSRTILVFTDGEETDGAMQKALEEVVQSGIQVIFLGFGSEQEIQILTGDGETPVNTALRQEELQSVVDSVNAKFSELSKKQRLSGLGARAAKVSYIPAQKNGSAYELLSAIDVENLQEESATTVYEMQGIPRWRLFCFLMLIFLILGFIGSELDLSFILSKSTIIILFVFSSLFFQGCSVSWKGSSEILEGTFHWYRKDFRKAVANFMQATEQAQEENNQDLYQFGQYGLAVTYLTQGEADAAIERFNNLGEDVSDTLRFSALYNSGIISYRNGKYKEAASLFKQALMIDETNVDAKINLELSLRQTSIRTAEASQEMIPVQENENDSKLESTIFSLIREKEQEKWKNQQSQEKSESTLDY